MKNPNYKLSITAILLASALAISSCGSSSSSSGTTNNKLSTASSTGVAAVGAALIGANITIVDSLGAKHPNIVVDSSGNYPFPAGLTGPVVMKAELTGLETLYSAYPVAPGQTVATINGADTTVPTELLADQININTLTNVMVRQGLNSNLDSYFNGSLNPTYDNINGLLDAVGSLADQVSTLAVLSGLLTEEDFNAANPFTAAMQADKQSPLDRLMESFLVECVGSDCARYKVTPKFPLPNSYENNRASMGGEFDPSDENDGVDPSTTAEYTNTDNDVINYVDAYELAIANMSPEWLIMSCDDSNDDPADGFTCSVQKILGATAVSSTYNPTTTTWN